MRRRHGHGATTLWGYRRGLSAPIGFCLLLFSLLPAAAAAAEAQRRFLLVYSAHSTLVANAEATAGMAAAFDRALAAGYEVYAEYRDDQRFPAPEADRAFAEEMRRKYAGRDFDAILAFGNTALDYAVAHRGALGMSAPVVFGGVTDGTLAGIDLPADVHGVSSRYSVSGTLALARRLQPDARRVVGMTGSGPFDRSWAERAAAEFAGVQGLAVEFVSGLTLEGFRQVAAGLGRDTILIILTVYEDAAGAQFTPLNAAAQIAGASGPPSWAVYDPFIGQGVVGGEVQRFRDIGAAMAGQALRLIDGDEAVEPMPRRADASGGGLAALPGLRTRSRPSARERRAGVLRPPGLGALPQADPARGGRPRTPGPTPAPRRSAPRRTLERFPINLHHTPPRRSSCRIPGE